MSVAWRTIAAKPLPWALLGVAICFVSEGGRSDTLLPRITVALSISPATQRSPAGPDTRVPRLVLRSTALIPVPEGAPSAHASALAAAADGELRAYWWAGSRESAADVAIYSARWSQGHWNAARRLVTREELSAQLGFGVRRLGNPAVWTAPDGQVHLYVVATGLGGWAASRVVQLISRDRGEHFSARRVLALSPLMNTSVLVRAPPVALGDGGWLLPAYFELGNKYPMLIAFDSQGAPQWTRRIGGSTTSLQPTLISLSATELRALMRDHGGERRIQQASSDDAGVSWREEPAAEMINEDSSIAALRLDDGGFVLAHNDQLPAPATPRQWLRLSTSADGQRWNAVHDVRLGTEGEEYSYPSLQQVGRQLHVSYTAQRRAIGHSVYDILAEPTEP